ncbi:MAG: HAD-IA family hydrolase [Alphaproteobacteria bacterium]|nr:HAD-IA family hydrolase [Alphaproteobacteria bacterium]
MPKLMGVIFDLDGTLLDSAPDLHNALNQTLVKYGRRQLSLAETKSMVGDGMMTLVQRALTATGGINPDQEMNCVRDFITLYRGITPDPIQIYPHVLEILEKYYAAGIKIGMCTNKQASMTNKLLKELDLLKYFGFVAGGDTFMAHKPNPDHIYGVIEALEVPRENCIMVGDSRNDVAASHGAGIPCIVVTLGYGTDFDKIGADKLIANFNELPAALSELGFEAP